MATLFLTTPQVAWVYLPLVVGEPLAWDGEGELLPCDGHELNADTFQRIISRLGALTNKVKFTFATIGKMNCWETGEKNFTIPKAYNWSANKTPQIHGAHHAPGEQYLSELFVTGDPAELEACKSSHRIILNGAYAEFLQQDFSKVTPTQITRTLFTLGVTLVHEISHALYCQEKHPDICKSAVYHDYDEPHVFKDTDSPEIGCAIERMLFGRHWQAIVHPERGAEMDSIHTPCAWDDGKLVVGRAHVANFIEPTWCHAFLTQAKWRQIGGLLPGNSQNCCNWPEFRVHGRTNQPSIMAWWEARNRGEKTNKMSDFDRNPGYGMHYGWEIVYGIENRNADGTWDTNVNRFADAVEAVQTLDHEFLEWKVQEVRKARSKQKSPKPQQKSHKPSAPYQISLADKILPTTSVTNSSHGAPHWVTTRISLDNIIATAYSRPGIQTLPVEHLNEEPTTPTTSSRRKPHWSRTNISMDNIIERPQGRQRDKALVFQSTPPETPRKKRRLPATPAPTTPTTTESSQRVPHWSNTKVSMDNIVEKPRSRRKIWTLPVDTFDEDAESPPETPLTRRRLPGEPEPTEPATISSQGASHRLKAKVPMDDVVEKPRSKLKVQPLPVDNLEVEAPETPSVTPRRRPRPPWDPKPTEPATISPQAAPHWSNSKVSLDNIVDEPRVRRKIRTLPVDTFDENEFMWYEV